MARSLALSMERIPYSSDIKKRQDRSWYRSCLPAAVDKEGVRLENPVVASTIGGSSTRHGRTRYPQRCAMPCSPHVRPVDGCCRQRLGCGSCTLATSSRPHHRGQSALGFQPASVWFLIQPSYNVWIYLARMSLPGSPRFRAGREMRWVRASNLLTYLR